MITNLRSTLISELELLVDRAKNGDRLDSALLPGTDTSKDFAKHKVLGRIYTYLQRVPKKMSFLEKIAITTLKLIQNANVGGVLENSGYLLPDGH